MLQTNSFEGGTNGTAITTANSGGSSGTAFNYTQGGTYTTAQAAHGTRSAACGANSLMQLQWFPLTVNNGNFYGRLNFRIVKPTVDICWAGIYLGTQTTTETYTWSGFVTVTPSGTATLDLYHYSDAVGTGTLVATKTITVSYGTWGRLELRADNNAPTSTAELRWYSAVDGTTITDSVTASLSHAAGVIPWDWAGAEAANSEASTNVWLDDFAVADTGYLGPVVPPSNVPKSGTDTGTLTNLASIAATLQRADSGTLTQQAGITIARADQATVTNVAQVQVAHTRADTGTVTSQTTVQAAHARTDSGHLTEQATVQVAHARTDGGTLLEGPRVIALAAADNGILSELSDVDQAFGPSTSDLGHLTEQAGIAVAHQRTDGGTLAELSAVDVLRYGTDTGLLTETAFVGLPATDGGTLTETATVTAALTAADAAAVGELAQAIQPVFAADTATLTELSTVISLGGDITRASPPYTDWAASTPYT